MDISASGDDKDSKTASAVIDPGVVLGDPLATPADDSAGATDDSTSDGQTTDDNQANAPDPNALEDGGSIVPNATVTTNDSSAVGEFKPTPPPEPAQEEFVEPESIIDPSLRPSANPFGQPESKVEPESEDVTQPDNDIKLPDLTPVSDLAVPTIEPTSPAEPDDPEKVKFIKTYTAEFEEAMQRATETVQKILDAIDTTINDHAPDIKIPEEANEFLDTAPKDGKVEKFEDAREIIRTIMNHAVESKEQSLTAATEAAKVYDEVQQFKRETKQQIADLTEED